MASNKFLPELKTRLVWLLLGLALSLGTAKIIQGFESTLEENLVLASFLPLVLYMGDAVGAQMEAMIIREINAKKRFDFTRFFSRQVLVVAAEAFVVGAVACVAVALLRDSWELGMVVGLALIGGILSSLVTGTVMPYIFWKMHDDPAEASGPIATVLQDMLSVIIFFLIAQTLL